MALIMLCAPAFGQTTAEEWFDKGVAFMYQNQYDAALQAFDKAIEINPQYVEAWAGKGWSLYGSGTYNEAQKAYQKAIELNPNYADAWVGRVFACRALNFLTSPTYPKIPTRCPYEAYGHEASDRAMALDPDYELAWIFGGWGTFPNTDFKINPHYAIETVSGTRDTLSFQRMVFLKEGCPRTLKTTATIPSPMPRKPVAKRFAVLNKQ